MSINRQHTAPVKVPRTRRNHGTAVLTSFKAGVCAPVAVFPMLREDAFSGRFNIALEMAETSQFIMNPVNMRVTAYVVPWLAMDRFQGSRDQFDRSYMGEPQVEGGSVVPFFQTVAAGTHGANAVYKTLGLHAPAAQLVNTMYLEAYNQVWNFRARNRSKDLTPRALNATTLAPAFWQHSRFQHVLPDFDQAVIDGEIALNLVSGQLPVKAGGSAKVPVKGIAFAGSSNAPSLRGQASTVAESGGADVAIGTSGTSNRWTDWADTNKNPMFRAKDGENGRPDVYVENMFAELVSGGVSVSLSNIELAKKTQAFAKLRERYEGVDDDWIIDMLMSGLTIPDQALKNPILIADRTVRVAQAKRYATDSGNLAEAAVSGGARLSLNLRVPKLSTGGVVMVLVECVPEQLFERQRDPFFYADSVDDLPEFLRDYLDPEKVDVVQNGEVDVQHSTPNNTFGYAPMNWKWSAFGPRVGGKFYKPATGNANDAERARLWGIETSDPSLSADFYIVNSMHQKPFLDTSGDPFELSMVGNAVLEGNTVFGGMLAEATGNYDAVLDKAPQERIEQE